MQIDTQALNFSSAAGQVASVSGPTVLVTGPLSRFRVTVGQFLALSSNGVPLVGVVTRVSLEAHDGQKAEPAATAQLNLIGEFRSNGAGITQFRRGISTYPAIGDLARPATSDELGLIFNESSRDSVALGKLHQNQSLDAHVNVSDMLSKHFAVLGTTGVGKSSGVVVLLNQIINARKDLRIFLLDVHNTENASGISRRRSAQAISSCRSGCLISMRLSMSFSVAGLVLTKRSICSRK
jgi:DNA helicase HerA-like ATPase